MIQADCISFVPGRSEARDTMLFPRVEGAFWLLLFVLVAQMAGILVVTDNGSPRLTSYRRVILNVNAGSQASQLK
jgi:hypothetical protein